MVCPTQKGGSMKPSLVDALFAARPPRLPSLTTDAQPPQAEEAHFVFLAGAIKYWWLHECDTCGHLIEDPEEPACKKCKDGVYAELWGTPYHAEYVKWRDDVRQALIAAGCLTYAPHEAFKGTWHEKAQAVNDAGIAMSDLMLVLSPPGIPTEGTDAEIAYAYRVKTPVLYYPPASDIKDLVAAVENSIRIA